MLYNVCSEMGRKMVSFLPKTLFKLHKMSGQHLVEVACLKNITLARDIIKKCAAFYTIYLSRLTKFKRGELSEKYKNYGGAMVSRPINKIRGRGFYQNKILGGDWKN